MRGRVFVAACLSLAVVGCGPGAGSGTDSGSDGGPLPTPPTQAEIDDAQAGIEAALAGLERARTVLEILGILPVYDCATPRGTFVGDLVAGLMADVACATAVAAPMGTDADTVTVTFAAGCDVAGHTVEGDAVFAYAGGEASLTLEADFWGVSIDGVPLTVLAGYGECGATTSYWVDAEGTVATPMVTFMVDGTLASQPGLPILGGTTIVLDGTASVMRAAGTDAATFTGLEYEIGELLPQSGTIVVTTASGHTVQVTFASDTPLIQTVQVTIDDHTPVTIPIVVSPL